MPAEPQNNKKKFPTSSNRIGQYHLRFRYGVGELCVLHDLFPVFCFKCSPCIDLGDVVQLELQ